MPNHRKKSKKGPEGSSSSTMDKKKEDAPDPLAGSGDQDCAGASQQEAPVINEAMRRKVAQKYSENKVETDMSTVPADTMPIPSDDVPIPQTGLPTPDERKVPEPQVPDEIRQSGQDTHQGSEEQLAEIEPESDSSNRELEELRSLNMELEKQNKDLQDELNRRDQFLPVETDAAAAGQGPAVDIASLVDQAWSQEKLGIGQDQEELDGHFKEMELWRDRVSVLREGLKAAADEFLGMVDKSAQIMQAVLEQLPPEGQESLNSRQNGLNLIAKMLHQQVARSEMALPVDEEPEMEFPTVGEQGWMDVVNQNQGNASSETVQRKLKAIGQKRYQVITLVRDAKEKYRKNFLQFSEKQLLPVLDSINDGEEYSQQEIEMLKAGNPDVADKFDAWFQTYGDLRDRLLKVLKKVRIWPIDVKLGVKIQYDYHEPFGVDSKPELENETILSVTRAGYHYASCEGEKEFVLRPAQVIVVKNKKD